MTTTKFRIGDHDYVADPMSTITQFHVTRRMASAVELMANVRRAAPDTKVSSFVRAFMGAISPLSTEDVDFALNACLSCVQRIVGDSLQRVKNGGQLQFSDISMEQMLEMMYTVLSANGILDFFSQPQDNGSPRVEEKR